MYSLTDFDFNLPAELIAQSPLAERTQSRLLHVQPDRLIDGLFTDVLATLQAGAASRRMQAGAARRRRK